MPSLPKVWATTKQWRWFVSAIAAWAGAIFIVGMVSLPERSLYSGRLTAVGIRQAPEIGAFAPTFIADTLMGQVDSAAFRGSSLIINFWATWCAPCAVEMPELQRLSDANPNLHIIAVNVGESRALIQQWAETFGLTFDLALDSTGEIARLYALRGQPSTYVIAPDGKITHIFFGATDEASLRNAIQPLD